MAQDTDTIEPAVDQEQAPLDPQVENRISFLEGENKKLVEAKEALAKKTKSVDLIADLVVENDNFDQRINELVEEKLEEKLTHDIDNYLDVDQIASDAADNVDLEDAVTEVLQNVSVSVEAELIT